MEIGQVVGRYKLVKLLGRGGMGAVYEAVHAATRKRAAVKVLSTTGDTMAPDAVARFQREVRAAGSIDSAHIVQIFDAGRDEATGLPFMAMELLSGETLEALCRRIAPLPPDVALRIAAQMCLGLSRAHDVGVIHRDIKPANVFLVETDSGERVVKILDFGIAKMNANALSQTATDTALTETGSMIGSPQFMSPEQALGEKDIDHRTDIWSLGCVLYKLLTGRTPFADCGTLGQVIAAIISMDVPHVQDVAPWVPPEIAAVVHGALGRKADDRYPSCAAMLEDIRRIVGGCTLVDKHLVAPSREDLALVARRYARAGNDGSLPANSPAPSGSLTSSRTVSEVAAAVPKRRRLLLPSAIGLALVLAGLGASTLRPQRSETARPDAVTSQPAAPSASASRRTAKVAVEPPTATVDVDGASAELRDGVVEIGGVLGSVHRVVARSGGSEIAVDVVVTEGGSLPARIVVPGEAGSVAVPNPRARSSPAAHAHAAGHTPAPAPPKPGGATAPGQPSSRMQPTTTFE